MVQNEHLSLKAIPLQPFHDYPDVLEVEQLTEALMIGKNSAYKLLKSGKLTSFKIGRIYKIPKVSLIAYISIENQNTHLK